MEEEIDELLEEDFFDMSDDLFKNLYVEGGVDNEDTAEEDCAGGGCKI